MSRIHIAPSVISADFGKLGADLTRVEASGADLLHVDIMDGHFVPNITFGPAIVAKIKTLTKLPLDVHLMISHPLKYAEAFAEAGAANITFHVESEDDPGATIAEIKKLGCKVGLTIRPGTPLTTIREYLGQLDRVLIMTVEPGFGGQKFMPDMVPKIEQAAAWRKEGGFTYDIEVDGGLDPRSILPCVRAGAEVIVAGTALFAAPDLAAAIRELREAVATL
jgi:ribulose-phosphate 3-epimerase